LVAVTEDVRDADAVRVGVLEKGPVAVEEIEAVPDKVCVPEHVGLTEAVCVVVRVPVSSAVAVRDAVIVGRFVIEDVTDSVILDVEVAVIVMVLDPDRLLVPVLVPVLVIVPVSVPDLEGVSDLDAVTVGVSVTVWVAVPLPLWLPVEEPEPVFVGKEGVLVRDPVCV
jgi:hypothetical protein